jgi:hypothetical protein
MKHPTPTKPGWFWAKWQIASDATRGGDELTPSERFEVVEVVENAAHGDPEHLLVSVSGVEASQPLDGFFWGAEVIPLTAPNRKEPGAGGEARKSHYGEGEQPWDVIVASGWGPAFAASCVLRYLRRDKALEHSLESARWYYARLVEGCAGRYTIALDWQRALDRLELILTKEERALARGGD